MTARRWATAEAFESDIKEYMTMCADKNRLANVAGFCVWAEITRETYYAQKDYYSDTYKRNEDRWEDEALNADIAPAVKIFYMKNKCGYKDKQEIDNKVTVERSPIDELVQSIEAIKNK